MKREKRDSNFELLRILLMVAIPLYHLCVYNGIMYVPINKFTNISLVMTSGSAIMADYAFMALSSFFLLRRKEYNIRNIEKKNTIKARVIKKFLVFLAEVIVIYFIKEYAFETIFADGMDNILVHETLRDGVWWFVEVYLVILLIYPILNTAIEEMSKKVLLLVCVLFGIALTINGCFNQLNLYNDFIAFIFTYFSVGYLSKINYSRFLGIPTNKYVMFGIYIVLYLATLVTTIKIKHMPIELEQGNSMIKLLIGKYCIFQYIMGICVFLGFKDIKLSHNKGINKIASLTFYVFLLHETVMMICWKLGILSPMLNPYDWGGRIAFAIWTVVYIICCFIVAAIIKFLYDKFLRECFEEIINYLLGKWYLLQFV